MIVIAGGGRRRNEEHQSLCVLCAYFSDCVLPSVGDVSVAKPFVGLGSKLVEFLWRKSSGRLGLGFLQNDSLTVCL
jgi:hypothetical protein